jgi:ketosteroid isomerase-like protein
MSQEDVEVVRRAWEAYQRRDNEAEEWIDAGDEVIAMVRWHVRGKLSGVPTEMLEAHVWTVRDGELWRLRVYPSKAEAQEALGLGTS